MLFFRAAWAEYDLARPGSLQLLPPPEVARILRDHYREMEAMFFAHPPEFEEVLKQLETLEREIHSGLVPTER